MRLAVVVEAEICFHGPQTRTDTDGRKSVTNFAGTFPRNI